MIDKRCKLEKLEVWGEGQCPKCNCEWEGYHDESSSNHFCRTLKIKVRCVCCGFTKEVGEEQKEMPMCDKCFSPMVAMEAKI